MLVGRVGSASALKIAMSQLMASMTTAFALSLGFIQRHEIEVDLLMQILRDSALYAPTFDKKLSRMVDDNYDNPNFPTKHLLKDTDFFIEEAKSADLNVRSIEGVKQIIEMAMKMSFAYADYSSIFAAIKSGDR